MPCGILSVIVLSCGILSVIVLSHGIPGLEIGVIW